MVLGKRWLFSIGNGAEIRPLEMGRTSPEGPFPAILGKGPWLELGTIKRHFGNF